MYDYPARLQIDYPESLSRLTTLLRLILIIPIYLLFMLLTGDSGEILNWLFSAHHGYYSDYGVGNGDAFAGSIFVSLFLATALMIVFRRKYPRWWFDFVFALAKFSGRITAYMLLLTDLYPATDEDQSYHLELDYPQADEELSRWLPLIKWLLAIPHYLVMMLLMVGLIFATLFAWFAILFTGRYPLVIFDFVVGVLRWWNRILAYVFWLTTDRYPPFSLR